jgi:molybdenum cofactor cytidylyltransferase
MAMDDPEHEGDRPASDAVPIAAVVLAAGRSSRMGRHKLLLPLGDRPLVAHAVAAACASGADPVLVVLGHEAGRVRAALPPGRFRVVENPDHAQGMASSLRAGMGAVPPGCAGTIVLLGDQPLVGAPLIDRLIEDARAHPDTIVAATYGGYRGNPVYFPRQYFAELAAVEGDEGGRSVLAAHPERIRLVECADVASMLDVDLPDDYERARDAWDDWRRRVRSLPGHD